MTAAPHDATNLLAEAATHLPDVIALRRDLHRNPELGLHLPRTQQAIVDALSGLPLNITLGATISSVVAVLEGDRPGPTTLLRGDMDALPLDEDTDVEFRSAVPGMMHACGHDAHVAMLVGAARLLSARRAELAGRVVFMFQPGEEGYDGASKMLDEGLLSAHGPVDRAFAIHVTPLLPSGMVATRPGPLLASSDSFEVTVTGKGGHASMPHDAVDPVPVACEVVLALQSMVTRRIPAADPAVLTVGSIRGGEAFNVIPERVHLRGTVRTLSEATRTKTLTGLRTVADGICAAHGCTATIAIPEVGYPVTVNQPAAVTHVLALAGELFGPGQSFELPAAIMGSEDWSYVLQQVPGCMAFLGLGPKGVADPAPNHSNRLVLDEDGMAHGIALHAAVALSEHAG